MIVVGWCCVALLAGLGSALIVWDLTAPPAPRRSQIRPRRYRGLDQSRVIDGHSRPSRTVLAACGIDPDDVDRVHAT